MHKGKNIDNNAFNRIIEKEMKKVRTLGEKGAKVIKGVANFVVSGDQKRRGYDYSAKCKKENVSDNNRPKNKRKESLGNSRYERNPIKEDVGEDTGFDVCYYAIQKIDQIFFGPLGIYDRLQTVESYSQYIPENERVVRAGRKEALIYISIWNTCLNSIKRENNKLQSLRNDISDYGTKKRVEIILDILQMLDDLLNSDECKVLESFGEVRYETKEREIDGETITISECVDDYLNKVCLFNNNYVRGLLKKMDTYKGTKFSE